MLSHMYIKRLGDYPNQYYCDRHASFYSTAGSKGALKLHSITSVMQAESNPDCTHTHTKYCWEVHSSVPTEQAASFHPIANFEGVLSQFQLLSALGLSHLCKIFLEDLYGHTCWHLFHSSYIKGPESELQPLLAAICEQSFRHRKVSGEHREELVPPGWTYQYQPHSRALKLSFSPFQL